MSQEATYVRAADIARLTGVHIRTVRRWITDEVISSTKLGGARLVAKVELKRLLSPSSTTSEEAAHDDDHERPESSNSCIIGKA